MGCKASGPEYLNGQYLEVRYEDLVTSPEETTREIFAHLEEPWVPDVLEFHARETEHYQRPISDASVGKWRNELTTEQKSVVKDVSGDLLIELGYADDLDW